MLHVYLDVHLVSGQRDETGSKGFYKPIVFPNDFWHLKQHYIEVNASTPSLPLQITYQPMSFWKFQTFASMSHGFNEAAKQQGASGAELDEIKRMLLETNPWFLALTATVSLLHDVYVLRPSVPTRRLDARQLRNACLQERRLSLASEEGIDGRLCPVRGDSFLMNLYSMC